jgi:hypothetical protein
LGTISHIPPLVSTGGCGGEVSNYFAFCVFPLMKINVYIDGFNLY